MLDVYNSGDHQWALWVTSFYEQDSDRAFTVGEVLQSIIDRHGLHFAVSASHSSPSHSSGKHARDLTPAVNMIENFISKACASCDKQFNDQSPQRKMCDECFSRRDKKAPKLSSADTTVTMTPAAQESFKQRRKFKDVKKNAKRWSKKGGASSSSDPPPAKKAKSAAVHMIITLDALDDDSTEHPFEDDARCLARCRRC